MSVVEMNSEAFEQALKSDKPVMIDFWASWCGPCMSLSPTIDKIASDNDGRIIVGKVNVDNDSKLAQDYGIRGIPALLFFKGGELIDSINGSAEVEKIQGVIDKLL